MATNVINIANGETIKVNNAQKNAAGQLVRRGGSKPTSSYLAQYPFITCGEQDENGNYILILAEGYEVATGRARKPRQPKPEAHEADNVPQTETDVHDNDNDTDNEPKPEAQPEAPKTQPQAAYNADGMNNALAAAFAPVFDEVARRIETNIRAEVAAEMAELKKVANEKARRIEVVANGEKHVVEGVTCEEFEEILDDVNMGYYPYLMGAAGCGKTHTAEQIAKALGFEFYPQTTIQFAHDVKGYGDAAGRFVDTAFYKAFANGGLYFQDEYDRSVAEAAIVLNTALANGYYDFPVVGRVYAHPKFRFMAAGNSNLKGSAEYTTAQILDPSSRDRVVPYEMSYDHRVEIQIAGGDEELVAFVEDVRRSIEQTGIEHVISYRATAYMRDHKNNKEKALKRGAFKFLEVDEIRMIYGYLSDKDNAWAKAMKKIF